MRVYLAIDLDDQPCSMAVEVYDEARYDMLATKSGMA